MVVTDFTVVTYLLCGDVCCIERVLDDLCWLFTKKSDLLLLINVFTVQHRDRKFNTFSYWTLSICLLSLILDSDVTCYCFWLMGAHVDVTILIDWQFVSWCRHVQLASKAEFCYNFIVIFFNFIIKVIKFVSSIGLQLDHWQWCL